MHPDLFTIPILDWPVKSYGAMLTLGFLSGVWLSMKRAERLKADPDIVLNIGFVSLICGVVGARIFFVVHYWESTFARRPNPFLAALDCTGGGLEYYGGLIGAIVGAAAYVAIKRASIRMYFDILAPGAVWGLAFGRVGCLLNGCCWGGLCVDAHGEQALPWAIRFPHSSPAQTRQWENRQLVLPPELIVTIPGRVEPFLLPDDIINMPVEEREGPEARVRALERELRDLEAMGADEGAIRKVKTRLDEAERKAKEEYNRDLIYTLDRATEFPSREDPDRETTVTELSNLAHKYRSLPVHPAQAYGIINALLLSWVLVEILYRRRRHGVVFAALCIIYPITRVILEVVRTDNPHDSFGLTISQAVSVGMCLLGVAILLYLRRLPLRSPLAVAYEPPMEQEETARE